MRKVLPLVIILTLLAMPAFAALKTNVFASWYSVTRDPGVTITPPNKMRDIVINNASSNAIAVDLEGGTIPVENAPLGVAFKDTNTNRPSIIQVPGGKEVYLEDFATASISMKALGASASPVTVIITY